MSENIKKMQHLKEPPCKDCITFIACKQTVLSIRPMPTIGRLSKIKNCRPLMWYIDTLSVLPEEQLRRLNYTRSLFGLEPVYV